MQRPGEQIVRRPHLRGHAVQAGQTACTRLRLPEGGGAASSAVHLNLRAGSTRRRGFSAERRAVDRPRSRSLRSARWWLHPPLCKCDSSPARRLRSRRAGYRPGRGGGGRPSPLWLSWLPRSPDGDGGAGRRWMGRPCRGTRGARMLCPWRPGTPRARVPRVPAAARPACRARARTPGARLTRCSAPETKCTEDFARCLIS